MNGTVQSGVEAVKGYDVEGAMVCGLAEDEVWAARPVFQCALLQERIAQPGGFLTSRDRFYGAFASGLCVERPCGVPGA